MDKEIFVKSVSLIFDKKKIENVTLKEADDSLREMAKKLRSVECFNVVIEITFEDNIKISEEIRICQTDGIIENIIRYYIIGNIRWKAGLMAHSCENPQDYLEDIKKYDTELYKRLYQNYSLFYSNRKVQRKNLTPLQKLIYKFQKMRARENNKVTDLKHELAKYDGILKGLSVGSCTAKEKKVIKDELKTLSVTNDRYHYLTGFLHGVELAREAEKG